MDDSELVEFLLNDDFNKDKVLLNESLEKDQKEVIDETSSEDDSSSNSESPKINKNLPLGKKTYDTESEFLGDLDSIILSTKNDNNLNTNEDNPQSKLRKKKKKLSVLQKLNDKLESKEANKGTSKRSKKINAQPQNVDEASKKAIDVSKSSQKTSMNDVLIDGEFRNKYSINGKTVIIHMQIIDKSTGSLDEETRFKISNAGKLFLNTTKFHPSLDKDDQKNDDNNSFKFKFTETDLEKKSNKPDTFSRKPPSNSNLASNRSMEDEESKKNKKMKNKKRKEKRMRNRKLGSTIETIPKYEHTEGISNKNDTKRTKSKQTQGSRNNPKSKKELDIFEVTDDIYDHVPEEVPSLKSEQLPNHPQNERTKTRQRRKKNTPKAMDRMEVSGEFKRTTVEF